LIMRQVINIVYYAVKFKWRTFIMYIITLYKQSYVVMVKILINKINVFV